MCKILVMYAYIPPPLASYPGSFSQRRNEPGYEATPPPHASTTLSLTQYPYEGLFRSTLFALMDNCCREYLFVLDFFGLTPNTAQTFFDDILGKTLAYLLVSEGLVTTREIYYYNYVRKLVDRSSFLRVREEHVNMCTSRIPLR